MEWQIEKRNRKRRTTFVILLIIWVVGMAVFMAVRILRPDEAVPIYYEDGDAEWINAPAQSDAPMTAKEKMVREMDERNSRFLNGTSEAPTYDGDYIP